MLFFQVLLIIGVFTTSIRADCRAADNPRKVIECVRHITSALYGAAVRDLRILCDVARDVASCVGDELEGCIGEEIGRAGIEQARTLARNCCPERNNDKCSIRDSNIADQKCFSADSLVTLADGKQKILADLRSGDQLIAYNHDTKQLVSTSLIAVMDYQPHTFALFKHITTSTGRQLSLTSSHLLPTPTDGYLMAKNIHAGMSIFVVDEEGALVEDRVSNVTDVVKQGYMAPLTEEGTVIVNNVAASCYATINSHSVAHAVVAPMRWWYRLFGGAATMEEKVSTGVHWFPKMLFDITASVLPSIIEK